MFKGRVSSYVLAKLSEKRKGGPRRDFLPQVKSFALLMSAQRGLGD
jgi:hypothetical protein